MFRSGIIGSKARTNFKDLDTDGQLIFWNIGSLPSQEQHVWRYITPDFPVLSSIHLSFQNCIQNAVSLFKIWISQSKDELSIHILIRHLHFCLWIPCSYFSFLVYYTSQSHFPFNFVHIGDEQEFKFMLTINFLFLKNIVHFFTLIRLSVHKHFPCLCFTFNFLISQYIWKHEMML